MGRTECSIQWIGMVMLSVITLIISGCSSQGGSGDIGAATVGGGSCAKTEVCPIADAGPDRSSLVGSSATLDGGSSYSGTTGLLAYQWTLTKRPAGSTATLSDATTVRPFFTADAVGKYTAELVLHDGSTSSSDIVTVTADTGNLRPIADAGPDRTVRLSTQVTLNGTDSYDPNGTPVTYKWSIAARPHKSTVTLMNASSATPSFTPDMSGGYKLLLTVSDGTLTSVPDSIEITTATGNILPIANAGSDQQVETGKIVTLTGAGSTDANADPLSYSWRFQSTPTGSTASVANATTVSPTFVPDFEGFYVLSLVVDDGRLSSLLDTVVIEARLPGFVNAVLQAYVKASNTQSFDEFGTTVALSGDTLAVSAGLFEASCATGINGNQTDNNCGGAGAVYVFTRTQGTWSQQAYVKASNTNPGDQFGFSLALQGDTLAVGAIGEDSCAVGINGDQANDGCFESGAVYVFTRTNGIWSQQAYVKASNTAAENSFAVSLALSGETLAVGARTEKSCATGANGDQSNNGCYEAGAVYVFIRTGAAWSQQAYLKASNTGINDMFGASVALSGDTLAVGASSEDSCATGVNSDQLSDNCSDAGAVYLYTRMGGFWSQQAYIKASNTESADNFGLSIALSEDTLAVSAFAEDSCATGVNGDQSNNDCNSAGAVYVFTRTGGVWRQQAYVKASNTDPDDNLGGAVTHMNVALNEDTLAISARFEDSCSTGVNGDQTDNSCFNSGAVYVFRRSRGIWSFDAYVKASNTEATFQDNFGTSVALSGSTLAVGARNESSCATGVNGNQSDTGCLVAGAAYIYERP
jgi:hypothetical protein